MRTMFKVLWWIMKLGLKTAGYFMVYLSATIACLCIIGKVSEDFRKRG